MIRVMECLGLIIFSLSLLFFDGLLVYRAGWESILWATLALPLGIYFADLATGLIHWACDSLGHSETPLWGPMLVKPFRVHHREPRTITEISLAENLGASAITGCLVMAVSFPILLGGLGLFSAWLWSWFLFFTVISNLFHRWSHLPQSRQPQWLKLLQKFHLILDSRSHLVHHRKPHRANYCILNGWANPLTNRVPWQRLETALKRFGILINFD